MRIWLIRISWAIVVFILVCLIIYFLGPRMHIEPKITIDAALITKDPDAYLQNAEARFTDIKDGARKQIIWADPTTKSRTEYAVLYIHGFSASAGEVRPLPDLVASRLKANLYFTRLTGHGRTQPDAMGEATLNSWLNDYAEAIAIGHAIADKLIIVSTSTGGTITAWGLTQAELSRNVAAAIFLSPNFGVKSAGAFLLTGPWASQLTRIIIGKRAGFKPDNVLHAKYWTTDYPSSALLPMAQTVKLAVNAPLQDIKTPALFVYSSFDNVVRPEKTMDIVGRWGGKTQSIDVGDIGTGSNHVIAGDALSPQMTAPLTEKIIGWLAANGIHAE
jgi:esterase/lipase